MKGVDRSLIIDEKIVLFDGDGVGEDGICDVVELMVGIVCVSDVCVYCL